MMIGLIIKIFGTLLDLGLPWVLAYMIDDVIPQKKVSLIVIWGVIMLILSIGARATNILANRMASKVARDSVEEIRHDLFEKILSLSSAQLDKLTIPSLVSRMTTDTYNIHQMIGMMQRLGVRAPIILIGGVMITITLDPILTLVLIGTLPFIVLVVYLVSKKGIPLYGIQQISVDHMVRKVRESISGIRIIKALNKTEYEKTKFDEVNKEVVDNELKAGITMATINPFMSLLLNGGLTFVVVVGAFRVNSGSTEIGKIVAFLSYFTIILNAMIMINRIFVVLSKASSSAARISEVLDQEEDLVIEEIEKKDSEYHIEVDNISFSYNKNVYNEEDKSQEYNIENLSFCLKKGESLGIIGSTGSGKTTIVNLLMRFYDVDRGSIRMNGEDIKSIPKQKLRKKFGVVFQNDILFASTIYENISFGREVSIENVKEAAKYGMAEEFINNLDNTFDTTVATKGANFSGGQKQRLLIARALADRPEILILDDSSSALDYKTDAMLRNGIKNHLSNTTLILIAQRISSIMNMDHILVLEDGEMVGYGKHEELLGVCETYNEIFKSQMGGDGFE
jgi:ATP-binding cassette subfamily B protein